MTPDPLLLAALAQRIPFWVLCYLGGCLFGLISGICTLNYGLRREGICGVRLRTVAWRCIRPVIREPLLWIGAGTGAALQVFNWWMARL